MEHLPTWFTQLAPPETHAALIGYARLLEGPGRRLGLIGFPTTQVLEQIGRALLLSPVIQGKSFVDVGSGAGLPGVPLGILRPGTATLVEPRAKAVALLEKVIRELKLDVRIFRGKAEDWARIEHEQAQAAVARALAPPAKAFELCAPLVAPGGLVVLTANERSEGQDLGEVAGVAAVRVEKLRASLDIEQTALIIRKDG